MGRLLKEMVEFMTIYYLMAKKQVQGQPYFVMGSQSVWAKSSTYHLKIM